LPPAFHGADECPSCGAPHVPYQEYCLDCGRRLRPVQPAGRGEGRAGWLAPSLVSLAVAALATTGVLAVRAATGDSGKPVLVATTEPGASVPVRPTVPTTAPVPVTPPEREPPTPTTQPTRPALPPGSGRLVAWPGGRSGYTVVLASLPASGGRAAATAKARDASRAGLARVGVLDSSRYSSLHPGYLVVFSGVFGSMEEATAAVRRARVAGYETAYAREIAA
jgi:hypothetical protein